MDFQRVCRFLNERQLRAEPVVLVTVVAVEGSSMRNPGTIMGVAADGSFEGSLSGGCIENAVVAEALDVLKSGTARVVRFGAGSPYFDIRLPCGGGLDLHFCPLDDAGFAANCLASIEGREPFSIVVGRDTVSHEDGWASAPFDPETGQGSFG
ncbi:MAG: XdhC family protein, partial [Pseudomonadota bacterium]|nr:XdhC family protein [Pseudomonadota bacterium]